MQKAIPRHGGAVLPSKLITFTLLVRDFSDTERPDNPVPIESFDFVTPLPVQPAEGTRCTQRRPVFLVMVIDRVPPIGVRPSCTFLPPLEERYGLRPVLE